MLLRRFGLVVLTALMLAATASGSGTSQRFFFTSGPNGARCEIDVGTLRYGRSLSLGPFRCTALRTGVRCIVTARGHGFVLGAHGVTRV